MKDTEDDILMRMSAEIWRSKGAKLAMFMLAPPRDTAMAVNMNHLEPPELFSFCVISLTHAPDSGLESPEIPQRTMCIVSRSIADSTRNSAFLESSSLCGCFGGFSGSKSNPYFSDKRRNTEFGRK
jgi:hypothetical protein